MLWPMQENQGFHKNENSFFFLKKKIQQHVNEFWQKVSHLVTTKMSKLMDNACLWRKKKTAFVFFLKSIFWAMAQNCSNDQCRKSNGWP